MELGTSTEEDEASEKWDRLKRKVKDDPLVPFGCLVTAGVLTAALRSFYVGNQKLSNQPLGGMEAGAGAGSVARALYQNAILEGCGSAISAVVRKGLHAWMSGANHLAAT